MDAATALPLVSTIVAAVIALTVPALTFRFALRQDRLRWLREQRAQLYIDLLTEAVAEGQWLEYAMAPQADRERFVGRHDDLRLPPLERARLGSRGTIFGSRATNKLFGRMQAEMSWAVLFGREADEGERIAARVRVGGLVDKLEAQVRKELGADALDPHDDVTFQEPHPAERRVAAMRANQPGPAGERDTHTD